jgi:hypothetical protein
MRVARRSRAMSALHFAKCEFNAYARTGRRAGAVPRNPEAKLALRAIARSNSANAPSRKESVAPSRDAQ